MRPSTALLSLEQTPPLNVPLRFFLAAPLFGVLAALLALWIGPEHFASRWQPGILAFVHLQTLGYLAMVMFGAMFQLLPVLVGVCLRRPVPTARVIHGLLVCGVVLLAGAFLSNNAGVFAVAGLFLVLGVGGFIAVIAHALWHACSIHETVCAMKLAVVALTITLALGVVLVLAHTGYEFAPRHLVIDLHLTWGLLGWAALLLIGVAFQVVPMFQITAEYGQHLRRLFIWAVWGLLIAWSLSFLHQRWLAVIPGVALAVTFIAFAVVTLRLQWRRLRRLPDVTVDFWYLGLGCILAAATLWMLQQGLPQSTDARPFELAWGVLVLVGAGGGVISGMLYKIVPFLIWLHLNNRMQDAGKWQGEVPTMRQVIAERWARRHLHLHTAAVLLLLLAIWLPGWMHYVAFNVLAAAYAVQFWNILGALRLYRTTLRAAGCKP